MEWHDHGMGNRRMGIGRVHYTSTGCEKWRETHGGVARAMRRRGLEEGQLNGRCQRLNAFRGNWR
jgi:hypothetical protein